MWYHVSYRPLLHTVIYINLPTDHDSYTCIYARPVCGRPLIKYLWNNVISTRIRIISYRLRSIPSNSLFVIHGFSLHSNQQYFSFPFLYIFEEFSTLSIDLTTKSFILLDRCPAKSKSFLKLRIIFPYQQVTRGIHTPPFCHI